MGDEIKSPGRLNCITDEIENEPKARFDATFCYLPKNENEYENIDSEPMGPIGPWATGKTTFTPRNGLTGVRPVSYTYSITNSSYPSWRIRNKELLDHVTVIYSDVDKNRIESEKAVNELVEIVENAQKETTKNLKYRVNEIAGWRDKLREVITRMQDEISTMEEQRIRIKKSLIIFGTPFSIVKECLTIRSQRPDTELLRDAVEEQLVREMAKIHEIQQSLKDTLETFELQQIRNRNLRERLEFDWSGKIVSYDIDEKSGGLHNQSKILMFNPSAMKVPPGQATGQYWQYFSEETLKEVEDAIEKSTKLRATLDSILLNAANELIKQSLLVEELFREHIRCVEENEARFTHELKECLKKLAEAENQILKIKEQIQSFTAALKVAQTRMDLRNQREGVENCQDIAQLQLIDEVKTNLDGVANLRKYLVEAERCKQNLIVMRTNLERQIMLKRRVLFLDRERCMKLRLHYPSESELKNF